jgi:hypothetical protein
MVHLTVQMMLNDSNELSEQSQQLSKFGGPSIKRAQLIGGTALTLETKRKLRTRSKNPYLSS